MNYRICECEKCKQQSIYYAPPHATDKEIIDDFEVEIIDGKIVDICTVCGAHQVEVPIDRGDIDTLCFVLSSMLEDDNRHNITSIGHLLEKIMQESSISEEQRRLVLLNLVKYYDKNHSLQI